MSKVREMEYPLCETVMKSKMFEKHLLNIHPQAFQDLQNAVSGCDAWQNEEGVVAPASYARCFSRCEGSPGI